MKKLILLLLTILLLSLGVKNAYALEFDSFKNEEIQYLAGGACSGNMSGCAALLGNPQCEQHVAYYIQRGLDILKYVGIVLCIVLTVTDFSKALFSDDKEMLKPLSKKAFSRLFYCVLLFFVPSIVKGILFLIDVYGTCGIN